MQDFLSILKRFLGDKFLLYLCMVFLLSCSTKLTETVGKPGEFREEQHPMFGFSLSGKKKKTLAGSHPPSDLIDGLKKYHNTFNSWPPTFYELFAISPGAQKAVSNMLGTNFSGIAIQRSTPDSLEITYRYHSISKAGSRNSDMIILNNKSFKRKYVFVYDRKDKAIFIDNMNVK